MDPDGPEIKGHRQAFAEPISPDGSGTGKPHLRQRPMAFRTPCQEASSGNSRKNRPYSGGACKFMDIRAAMPVNLLA